MAKGQILDEVIEYCGSVIIAPQDRARRAQSVWMHSCANPLSTTASVAADWVSFMLIGKQVSNGVDDQGRLDANVTQRHAVDEGGLGVEYLVQRLNGQTHVAGSREDGGAVQLTGLAKD
ncbi:uncharacterized protein ATNIH1004_006848 [Aspergillus tanneri]|uniref:Uncharacterized protein n=1 Tax=Aspergillus tanneri TaxID=1220188 RepID=A0A5M9MLV0_9EURO|nr:uncharacterized protein ATNIH1004_006848 [Aspergillus tanneri]KAA8645429.1 hypothetical protein ATNIH1004_006848 [Aspergillus tanneri]